MARQAKGETPEATKNLLRLKYGPYIETRLTAGENPWTLAQELSDDTQEREIDVEQRDKQGKVTGTQPQMVGRMTVTGEQLVQWFPHAAELGEPPDGHTGPDDKATKNVPKDS